MLASHTIIDGFLGEELSGQLLDFALAREEEFEPTSVFTVKEGSWVRPEVRSSFRYSGDWEAQHKAFFSRIEERIEEVVSGAGSAGFRPDTIEMELVATRDGGRFTHHIDTRTQIKDRKSDRIVSAVYYFHRQPRVFTGGELIMHPLVGDETKSILPLHDRLIVFTSMAPHEVAETLVPGNAFADARFSINCWLHRVRK